MSFEQVKDKARRHQEELYEGKTGRLDEVEAVKENCLECGAWVVYEVV